MDRPGGLSYGRFTMSMLPFWLVRRISQPPPLIFPLIESPGDRAAHRHLLLGLNAPERSLAGHGVSHAGGHRHANRRECGLNRNRFACLAGLRRHGDRAVAALHCDRPARIFHHRAGKRRLGVHLAADAGHPYARVPSRNARAALDSAQVDVGEGRLHGRRLAHRITGDSRILRHHAYRFADSRELDGRERCLQVGDSRHRVRLHLAVLVVYRQIGFSRPTRARRRSWW